MEIYASAKLKKKQSFDKSRKFIWVNESAEGKKKGKGLYYYFSIEIVRTSAPRKPLQMKKWNQSLDFFSEVGVANAISREPNAYQSDLEETD